MFLLSKTVTRFICMYVYIYMCVCIHILAYAPSSLSPFCVCAITFFSNQSVFYRNNIEEKRNT